MIYIITGTSSGIGEAVAKLYLDKGENVIGISRKNTLVHEHFTFIPCDLGNIQEIQSLSLSHIRPSKDNPICLINNAGTVGEIKRSHHLSLQHYLSVAMINVVAPQYLSSYILKTFGHDKVSSIVNISSGAGSRPIPSWSAYCASKASIDLFAETLQQEIKETHKKTRIFNLAPGVVDTAMQKHIRSSLPEDFSSHNQFVSLKNNNQLRTPNEVATLIYQFLNTKQHFEEDQVFYRL